MEKITKYFKYSYENDTTIEYVNTGLYSMLNCSYTSEDPDYGTDTIHFTANPAESMEKMAYNMLYEIKDFLDYRDGSVEAPRCDVQNDYGEYSNSTLIAIEYALSDISKGYVPDTNKNGHRFMIGTVINCARELISMLNDGELKTAYVAEEWDECDPADVDGCESWYRILNQPLYFDNSDSEKLLVMGYCGGGSVATAYIHSEFDDPCAMESLVADMICNSIGCNRNTKIYMEFVRKNDKHSYEIEKQEEEK